jgi:hypothetical protein
LPPGNWRDYDGALPVTVMHRVALLGLVLAACGCETAEQVEFGDPGRVAGGFSGGETDPGADCVVNNACTVSWKNRIYPAIFDAPLGGDDPTGACGAPKCHASGAGGLLMPTGNQDESYVRLSAYTLVGGRHYIVPCHPELSHMMCNLRFASDVDNPYIGPDNEFTGGCGSPMPKPDEDVDSSPLNQDQLEDIATWIACGAPQN